MYCTYTYLLLAKYFSKVILEALSLSFISLLNYMFVDMFKLYITLLLLA